jgi:hypothetical protein
MSSGSQMNGTIKSNNNNSSLKNSSSNNTFKNNLSNKSQDIKDKKRIELIESSSSSHLGISNDFVEEGKMPIKNYQRNKEEVKSLSDSGDSHQIMKCVEEDEFESD